MASGASQRERQRPSGWPLRLHLLLIVSIALLPVAVASFVQGTDRAQRDIEEIRERLESNAQLAAAPEQNVLAAAEQIARVLADLPQVRNVSAGCDGELAAARSGLTFITNITRADPRGRIVCSALSGARGLEVSGFRGWHTISSNSEIRISETASLPTHQRIILMMLPIRDDRRQLLGALDMGIDVHWLDDLVHRSKLPQDAVVALFDRSGIVIASNDWARAATLFRHPDLTAGDNSAHAAKDLRGRSWIFATAPLLGDNIFVGFAIEESAALKPTYFHVATDFILPFAMLVLTWLAIWIAAETQITRWIVYLRRIASVDSAGHYALRPRLTGASREFQVLGAALAAMAQSIRERDRSLRDALVQKSLLIRGVHHRVKNNLQIVMSLLNLQAGRLRDPAAQDALRQARARINALALVHRILYEIEDQRAVDVKSLLEQLAEQTREGFGGDRRDITSLVQAETVVLPGESAVPVALFVVEALAYKHAFPIGRGGTITLRLHQLPGGRLTVSVADDGVGIDSANIEASVGGRLISTFGQQLGGTTHIRSRPRKGTIVELVFPERIFPESEATEEDQADAAE